MTDAEKLRDLTAERFRTPPTHPWLTPDTEAGGDDGRRARFVATMHALIAYVLDHPDMPIPWALTINSTVTDRAQLDTLAAAVGVHTYGIRQTQFHVDIPAAFDETGMQWIVSERPL